MGTRGYVLWVATVLNGAFTHTMKALPSRLAYLVLGDYSLIVEVGDESPNPLLFLSNFSS